METNESYRIVGEAIPVVEPEVVVDETEEEPETEPAIMLVGTVANCTMLNIRSGPGKEFDVVAVVSANTKVMVDPDDENDEWYNVWLETGINGFCMKDYIILQQ